MRKEVHNEQHSGYDPRVVDNYKENRLKGARVRIGFICDKHGYVRADHCPECYQQRTGSFNINDESWVSGWYEHIDAQPIYIESKSQLIAECEKRGLVARAFMKRKSQGKGWVHR